MCRKRYILIKRKAVKKTKEYTIELAGVINYMTDDLLVEFPTQTITAEYLVLSIFDRRQNHARLILENYLTTNSDDEVRAAIAEIVMKQCDLELVLEDGDTINTTAEYERIMKGAEREAVKTKSKDVGTEHVLLAIMNPMNKVEASEIFKVMGVTYDNLLENCRASGKVSKAPELEVTDDIPEKAMVNAVDIGEVSDKGGTIEKYTTNINKKVSEEEFSFIGREKETRSLFQVLGRKNKNNAVVVGDSGVGKTSLVYNIANRINRGDCPDNLRGKIVLQLNIMALLGGTSLRGILEERVDALFAEMQKCRKYILFIDNIENVLKVGAQSKDADLTSMLDEIMSGGKTNIIGTTTKGAYHKAIEANPQIENKLQRIVVEPMSADETFNVLKSIKGGYEKFHNVFYDDDILRETIGLCERYVTKKGFPDSAIDAMDLAGAKVASEEKKLKERSNEISKVNSLAEQKEAAIRCGDFEKAGELVDEINRIKKDGVDKARKEQEKPYVMTMNDMFETISTMSNIPIEKLSCDERKSLNGIDDVLKSHVVGQDEAVDCICRAIKRNKIGLGDKNRPLLVAMLVGQSGCGKTLVAKELAEHVYGDRNALIRIDMSEYSEKNSVARLTGSAPGYIGYEKGGQLTEAVKNRPHCVILLDEIEKADKEVYNVFLQLFDEGRLTDSGGCTVNFRNTMILMTSNVGAKKVTDFSKQIGFGAVPEDRDTNIVKKELKHKFAPEFLNRIDKTIYFNELTDKNIKAICELEIGKLTKRMEDIGYGLTYTKDVVNAITKKTLKNKEYGARPLRRIIQDEIEDAVTELLISGDYDDGYAFNVTATRGGKIAVK